MDDVAQAAGTMSFADRLVSAQLRKRSLVILGIDPQLEGNGLRFPEGYDLRKFCLEIVDACFEHVVAIKTQLAFFEARGVEGMEILRDVLSLARSRGLLTIADGKRGDIDSVSTAYAEAYLGSGGDFECDALTLNVYMGEDVVTPFAEKVRQGKGLFICVKTSNKSSGDFQDLMTAEGPAWELLARKVKEWGQTYKGDCGFSSIGAVVGATYPKHARRARELMPDALFLVPGYGAQGADASDAVASVRKNGLGAIVNASRSLMYAYQSTGEAPGVAAKEAAKKMKDDLNKVLEESGRSLEAKLSIEHAA